jgi:fucose permease
MNDGQRYRAACDILPVVTGAVADRFGIAIALLVPVLCYLWILAYGILMARGLGLVEHRSLPSAARGS